MLGEHTIDVPFNAVMTFVKLHKHTTCFNLNQHFYTCVFCSKDGKAGDVLNDIGNMLQDLTDELDAMLEFELE